MNKGLLACFALAFFYTPGKASAQFNDTRAYDNTPIGVSQQLHVLLRHVSFALALAFMVHCRDVHASDNTAELKAQPLADARAGLLSKFVWLGKVAYIKWKQICSRGLRTWPRSWDVDI